MSEALIFDTDETIGHGNSPDLRLVPETVETTGIVQPECDESGRVIRPAIDLTSERTPNGQPLIQFYLRGSIAYDEAEHRAARALADAKSLARSSDNPIAIP